MYDAAMFEVFQPKQAVGIIGGGQLALMLANAAVRMGLRPVILTESSWDPAARAHPNAILGSAQDAGALALLFSQTDRILMENEFLDCGTLRAVQAGVRAPSEIPRFFPSLEAIEKLQDKLEQKKILKALDIPSAEFKVLNSGGVKNQLKQILADWSKTSDSRFPQGRCVLKWSRLGYDGKGVCFVDEGQLNQSSELRKIEAFCELGLSKGGRVFAERAVQFQRELAMIAVRSTTGEFVSYPLVISEQIGGVCGRVFGPATRFGVSIEQEKRAHQYAKALAEETDFVGAFALEFFETGTGELWVNEIAPRVHNSGHYTQDACATDQFENHLRATLGWPLGSPVESSETSPSFAMLNLLGPEGYAGSEDQGALPLPGPRSHLHWYGKREMKSGRKMGHLNGTIGSDEDIQALLGELDQCHQQWLAQLKSRADERGSS